MFQKNFKSRIEDLKQQIAAFPPGSITKKKINGKDYFYRRWTEDKKRKEKYIPMTEVETVRQQIEQRRLLEQELKILKVQLSKSQPEKEIVTSPAFVTNVRTWQIFTYIFGQVFKKAKKRVLSTTLQFCLR